jgi:hypothetical protein
MTEQDSMRDERVARFIQAARELIDAYERKSTANEHFLKLEAAVDALGAWRHQRADTSRPRPGDPTDRGVATVDGCALHPTDRVVSDTPQGSGGRLEHRTQFLGLGDAAYAGKSGGSPADVWCSWRR